MYLEQDRRRENDARREDHVQYGRHDRRIEDIEGLIQVDHLYADTYCHSHQQEPRQPVGHLAVSPHRLLERDAEPLARHDGERADRARDGHIDERVLLAVVWLAVEDKDADRDDDDEGVDDKTCKNDNRG